MTHAGGGADEPMTRREARRARGEGELAPREHPSDLDSSPATPAASSPAALDTTETPAASSPAALDTAETPVVRTRATPPPRPSNPHRSRAPKRPKRKPRVTVVGVIGELLMTAGVLVFAFLGWKLIVNDIFLGQHQNARAESLTQQWESAPAPVTGEKPITEGEVPTLPAAGKDENFALLRVPRWGADYQRPIAEGIDAGVALAEGVGHYPNTALAGQPGNFALAAHRVTYGAPFKQVVDLQVGDPVVVETQLGWYVYRYRNTEYVLPSAADVILPVPGVPNTPATDRLLTMTSCNPQFSTEERIISFAVFDRFVPRSLGTPAELGGES